MIGNTLCLSSYVNFLPHFLVFYLSDYLSTSMKHVLFLFSQKIFYWNTDILTVLLSLLIFGLANHLDGSDLVFWTSCGTLYYGNTKVERDQISAHIMGSSPKTTFAVLLYGSIFFFPRKQKKTLKKRHLNFHIHERISNFMPKMKTSSTLSV